MNNSPEAVVRTAVVSAVCVRTVTSTDAATAEEVTQQLKHKVIQVIQPFINLSDCNTPDGE